VDLSIADGVFVGVLGPNGAGKTTLMRALLGLISPKAGTMRVLGGPVTRGSTAIGYMPQTHSSGSVARLSGRAFVAAAVEGSRWGIPYAGRAGIREVDRVLDLVGATSLAVRPLSELSGGERQRLLLAQSLLGTPRLLLLDEPLISLDPHFQRAMVELVGGLQKELKLTVLFSAHELNPLLGVLDQVLYLGGGHAALGTVDEVITGPVLSRLYGSEIEVVHLNGRIFVMSGQHEIERDDHQHGHDHGHVGHHDHA
jgi:zinc/manganese transport system ATP-binding protein